MFGQVIQEWIERYNGPSNNYDYSTKIAVDNLGNVYVTGISYGNYNYDFVTIKFNSSGVQQWNVRYNGPANYDDGANSIAVDRLGNVYVTGSSDGIIGIGTNPDYATIKYNSSGVQQWVARYNGPSQASDIPSSLAIDNLGNVYVTGWTALNANNNDYATVKYNSLGVQQWVSLYNGPGNSFDYANSIDVDNLGNVYVTGKSKNSVSSFSDDYATIKYNYAGVQQWIARYNGPANRSDIAISIAIDNDSNVLVTGTSDDSAYTAQGYVTNTPDFATVKYNSAGILIWSSRYGGPANNPVEAASLVLDRENNVYVTGTSFYSSISTEYATVKYDSSGIQQWATVYNGPGNEDDRARFVTVDNLGNSYVTGYSMGSNSGHDFATVKYNSNGIQQWVARYNGDTDGWDEATCITVDSFYNVYVTGRESTGYFTDIVAIKYSQPIGIRPISSEIPAQFSLLQNYPNPFNPATKIRFSISSLQGTRMSMVRLVIYDILGREITTLVNEWLKPGIYEVEWDATNYPSGVYFYKLETSEFVDARKMVLIK
ncbi:MAG TPA: SBBP repeat-containing protein [Ignavibacteria bacterium]